ncbi:MAG: ImmA/IrrE family metallo-endopeptidase [Gemmatimonadaceae bacterium]
MAGCLVAHRGVGIIFVCGADPSDELRITIAHEVAHVLLHYLRPRFDAIRSVGPTAVEILDGTRSATMAEQTQAILSSIRLHPHIHLLERGPRGDRRTAGVGAVEREANELALELLAPREAVIDALRLLDGSAKTPQERRLALGRQFGIPSGWFHVVAPDQQAVPADPLGYLFASLRRQV